MILKFMGGLVRNAEGATSGGTPAAAPALATLAGAAALAQPSTTPASAPATGEAPPAPAEKQWWDALPDGLKNTAMAKAWKTPADAVESYANLEKTITADKLGYTVVRPKEDAPAEEYGKFFRSLGVPESADKYDLKAPEGMDASIVETAKTWMHKAAVHPKQAQSLIDAVAEAEAAKMAEWQKQSKADMNDLAVEWGAKFEDNSEVARRAFRAAGLNADQVEKIEMAIGTKQMLTMFHRFGQDMAEAAPPPAAQGGGQFVMNKAEAQQRIAALRANPEFQARYMSPNNMVRQQAIAELEELQKIAAS